MQKHQRLSGLHLPAAAFILFFHPRMIKTGTCVWEARNVEELQKFLDNQTEGMATNFCYPVNESAAIGLPERKKGTALN